MVLAVLLLAGCFWSQPYATQTKSVAPQRPKVVPTQPTEVYVPIDDADGLPWPPRGTTAERAYRSQPTEQRRLPGGVLGLARDWSASSSSDRHLDMALLRLTLPVGSRSDQTGVAELAAWAVAEIPAPGDHRPALRRSIEEGAGSLRIRVGAQHTSFELTVARKSWAAALEQLIAAIRTAVASEDQTERLRRSQVVAERRRLSAADLATAIEILWTTGAAPERYLTELEDRTAAEVEAFRNARYRPAGAVLALWIPGQAPGAVLDAAGEALTAWSSDAEAGSPTPLTEIPLPRSPEGPRPDPEALKPAANSIVWAADDGDTCRFALVLPLPPASAPGTLGTLAQLECVTMEGVGGRLERAGADRLEAGIHDDVGIHRLVLMGEGSPARALETWKALTTTLATLTEQPPRGSELHTALDRLRLRLLARHDDPWGWLDLATQRGLLGAEATDLTQQLEQIEKMMALDPDPAVKPPGPAVMVVVGGRPPAEAGADVTAARPFADAAGAEAPDESAAQIEAASEPLAAAVRALGGKVRLSQLRGLAAALTRRSSDGAAVAETIWFAAPDGLRAVRQILATTIETVIGPRQSYERVGEKKLQLTHAETELILDRVARHPLMLMAAQARGEVEFRLVSTRRVGDREMAVLERVDPERERLRILVDTGSGLIRTVETRERRVDLGARVHVTERYDDYRPLAGIRVPFRCITTIDSGGQEITTTWSEVLLGAPPPQALAPGGPMSLPGK